MEGLMPTVTIMQTGKKFLVCVSKDVLSSTYPCDTLAEAYLRAAKWFHQRGMIELQERINKL